MEIARLPPKLDYERVVRQTVGTIGTFSKTRRGSFEASCQLYIMR